VPELKDEVYDWCINAKVGCTECKKRLAAKLVEKLKPFHKRRQELLKDKTGIKEILETGREKATLIAFKTIKEAREAASI
jgi:tryptophanyl-tRNA synthetase